jgi:outer membrane lipase/esterase
MPTLDRAPALACALALACAPNVFAAPYSSLTVFGDSLSDAGYALADDGSPIRYTNPVGPTYREGEAFGPVAPMLLGAQLGLAAPTLASVTAQGDNHAVGGLRTDQIQATIDAFLEGGRADPNALYYITSGGNDFIQFRVTSVGDAQKAADRLTASVETLQSNGARTIMVWLLPISG